MEVSRDALTELTELIEDSVEFTCDNYRMSGETAWKILDCLATAKLAELNGELAPV